MTDRPSREVAVSISYSQQDEEWLQRLMHQLEAVRDKERGSIWYDLKMHPGSDWDETIAKQLESADVIILLVTPAYLSTPYVREKEIRVILRRCKERDALVIPVLVKPVDLNASPLAEIQNLLVHRKAIAARPQHEQEDALVEVIRKIRESVKDHFKKNPEPLPLDILAALAELRQQIHQMRRRLSVVERLLGIAILGLLLLACYGGYYMWKLGTESHQPSLSVLLAFDTVRLQSLGSKLQEGNEALQNSLNVAEVKRWIPPVPTQNDPGYYQVWFKGSFPVDEGNTGRYKVLVTTTSGSAHIRSTASDSLIVVCNPGAQFCLAVYGEFTPKKE